MKNKDSKANAGLSFTIFAFLWAMATVFHLAKWSHWLASPAEFILAVSAFSVLLRPSSILRFSVMVVIQLWQTTQQMPWISNHWLFTASVNSTILLALFSLIFSTKSINIERSQLFLSFAPAVRIELMILYLFSFFHKLNTDWFKPEVSCGAALYLNLADKLHFLPTSAWAQNMAIYGSLIIEAIIPVFLLIPRFRMVGLILAAVFHFILGIDTYYNFSAMIFALLFLFAPENFPALLQDWWTASSTRKWVSSLTEKNLHSMVKSSAAFFIIAFAVAVLIKWPWPESKIGPFILIRESVAQRTAVSYGFEALWWVYGLALIILFLLSIQSGQGEWGGARRLFALPHKFLAILPILVFFNGLSPYLGLKTETSFSMFSNLRTEGSRSNHLVVNRPLRLTNYQDDLTTIQYSSDPTLQKLADLQYRLPYFELRSYISLKAQFDLADIELRYFRDGELKSVTNIGDDPELFLPHSTLLRKFLYFRPVRPKEINRCQH